MLSSACLNSLQTPKRKLRLSVDSDDSFNPSDRMMTSGDSRVTSINSLRTRLFDEEESRDSGLGMDNDLEDDLFDELPVRNFAFFRNGQDRKEENIEIETESCKPGSNLQALVSSPVARPTSCQKRKRPLADEGEELDQDANRRCLLRSSEISVTKQATESLKSLAYFGSADESCYADPTPNSTTSIVTDDEPFIGDSGQKLILPTVAGKHRDLNSVSPETLAAVLNLEFSSRIKETLVIDCRYPYEYKGGHIKGAINCYTKQSIVDLLLTTPKFTHASNNRRSILVFHCEFSSERAPKMCRFLREMDRAANKECYPKLHYPEIYLLDGGYKNFFHHNQTFCTPPSYLPMAHKDYKSEMRRFRIKSKSWSGDKKSRSVFGFKANLFYCESNIF